MGTVKTRVVKISKLSGEKSIFPRTKALLRPINYPKVQAFTSGRATSSLHRYRYGAVLPQKLPVIWTPGNFSKTYVKDEPKPMEFSAKSAPALKGLLIYFGRITRTLFKMILTPSPGLLMVINPGSGSGNGGEGNGNGQLLEKIAEAAKSDPKAMEYLKSIAEGPYPYDALGDSVPDNIQALLHLSQLWEEDNHAGALVGMQQMNSDSLFEASKAGRSFAIAGLRILGRSGNPQANIYLSQLNTLSKLNHKEYSDFTEIFQDQQKLGLYRGEPFTLSLFGHVENEFYVNEIRTMGQLNGNKFAVLTRTITRNVPNLFPLEPSEVGGFLLKAGSGADFVEVVIRSLDRDLVAQIHLDLVEAYQKSGSASEALSSIQLNRYGQKSIPWQSAVEFYKEREALTSAGKNKK